MLKKTAQVLIFAAFALSLTAGADTPPAPLKLSAAEIVNRNISARGGLQAWRSVRTMSMTGTMEAGGNSQPTLRMPGRKRNELPEQRLKEQAELPFVMDLKRPRKTRIEIKFKGQTALQVYDGANGWKVRPFLNRHDVEPFTTEELKAASLQADLDGYLIDYAAKGTKLELADVEKVENRDAYKLELTLKNGQIQHVWVDSETFLEIKIEGTPRRLDGKYHAVSIYPRDYRTVNRLRLPFLLETSVDGVKQTEKIRIETAVVDPKLDDSLFAKLQ